jgi:hypothetical protein
LIDRPVGGPFKQGRSTMAPIIVASLLSVLFISVTVAIIDTERRASVKRTEDVPVQASESEHSAGRVYYAER